MTTKEIVVPRTKVEIVVYNHNKELMVLAPCERSPWWAIPGGGIDSGETHQQAAVRECLEEAGCRIKNLAFLDHTFVYKGEWNKKMVDRTTHYYMAQFNGRDLTRFNADGDGRVIHWFRLAEATAKLQDTLWDKPRKQAMELAAVRLFNK